MSAVLISDQALEDLKTAHKVAREEASNTERRYTAAIALLWAAQAAMKDTAEPSDVYGECKTIRVQLEEALKAETAAFEALTQAEADRAKATIGGNLRL